MKKLLLACLMFSTALTAQISYQSSITLNDKEEGFYRFQVIPQDFSANNDERICIQTDTDKIAIYNNEFQRTRLLVVPSSNAINKQVQEHRENLGNNIYADEWTVEMSSEWKSDFEGAIMVDFDSPNADIVSPIMLTQTLFNEDASYEYISLPWFLPSEPNYEFCWNQVGEECVGRTASYYSIATSFDIKQDNGNIVQSCTFSDNFYLKTSGKDDACMIMKIGGNYYLIFSGYIGNDAAYSIFRINRHNTALPVQQMGAPIRVSAYPNPSNRNQMLNIVLSGENAGRAKTDVQVTNLNGQVTGHQTIPVGQNQTTMPASNFAPGLNLIRVLQNGQPVDTKKVLVE